MMREWSSRAAPVVAEVELFEAENPEPASPRGEPVQSRAPDAAQPTTMYSNAFFPVPSCPRPAQAHVLGFQKVSTSHFAAYYISHTVQLVAGLGYARPHTPLAFI